MNRSALLGKALLEVLAEFAVFAVLLFISGLRGHHAHRHRGRRESALGDLIADAQRTYAGAQIAFMNPGGIRADIQQGPITYGELFTVQPFDNQVVKMEL